MPRMSNVTFVPLWVPEKLPKASGAPPSLTSSRGPVCVIVASMARRC